MHTHAPTTEAGIKAQAQLLKSFMQSKNVPLNHMSCLDAVSVQYGYPSWQHARAALAQHQVPALTPQAAAEAQVKQISDLIIQFGAVHEPVLRDYAAALLKTNLTPVYTGEYKRRADLNGIERECHLLAQQPLGPEYDATFSARLFFDMRFDADVLHLEPTMLLDVTAIGELDWQCCVNGDEFVLDLSDPGWTKKLKSFVQSIPVQSWVQQDLDAQDTTFEELSAYFGKVLFGR